MNADEFSYTWTTEKDCYVLVETEFGLSIVNKRTQMVLCISDETIEETVIKNMQRAGCKTYKNILDAYSDV